MQKYDKMVELVKKRSEKMTEVAIAAIEKMYRDNVKISVSELANSTGLSRAFFYNNVKVKRRLMELKEKQAGKILRNPKSDAIAKVQEIRIKDLEQKLSNSVSKNEYEKLQKQYKELKEQFDIMKDEALSKVYEQL